MNYELNTIQQNSVLTPLCEDLYCGGYLKLTGFAFCGADYAETNNIV